MKLLNKNSYILELPYKIVYFIFAIFTYCNLTFMQPIMTVAVNTVLLFGSLTGLLRLFKLKGYLKTPGLGFAIAFFISFILSFLLNIEYGYADNFKGLVWMGLHFFTIFACDLDRDEQDYQREFSVLTIFYLAVFFVMSAASFAQYLANYSQELYLDTHTQLAGFVWGRLWGVYRDPNYGSVFAVIAIVLSVYYIRTRKALLIRIFLILNAVIQFLYLTLSGSRTGIVTLFACALFYSFLVSFRKFEFKPFLKVTLSVAVSLAIAVIGVCLVSATKQVNNKLIEIQYQDQTGDDQPDSPPSYDEDRQQDIENDISNRRFDLWRSGVEIFATKPIFGVSFYNLQPYALAELPDTYLVNNDRGKFNNMHNLVFNILPAQGAVGFLVFVAFALFAVVYIFKNLFKEQTEHYEYLVVMMVCIIGILVSSLFVSDVIYVNSPTSLLFWLFLGYLLHFFKRKKV